MEPNPFGSFALSQLVAHKAEAKRQYFQPHPPGILQAGSATQAVNAFLESHPDRFFTHAQIILVTGRTSKSVDWALLMLRSMGRLEWRSDESRNPRYRRYRFIPESTAGGDTP